MTQDARQDMSVQKFCDNKHRATVEAATGFGKTRIGIKAIKLLRRNDKTRKVIVIVPTLQLQQQWRTVLAEFFCYNDTEVYVINSFVKMSKVRCTLLILDEIHRYAADTFSKVFDVCLYSFVLGLTATMSRQDRKHVLLQQHAPICDRISVAECRKNRWISQMTEYNLAVEMSDEEKEYYNKMKQDFAKYFDKFGQDFGVMKDCAMSIKPKIVWNRSTQSRVYYEPAAVRRAKMLGWVGNSPAAAHAIMMDNASRVRGTKIPVWGGNQEHPYHPEKIQVYALLGMRLNREMTDFVYKMETKIDVAEKLIREIKVKTVTFAELIETADKLAERFPGEAEVYHSDVKAAIIDGKKVSGAKRKRDAIAKFKSGEVNLICTAKAIDEGADFPDAVMGVILSRTSVARQYIQRIGRISRKFTYDDGSEKESIIVNIYVKDTKDKNWLIRSQKNHPGIIEVETIEEILENEGVLESSGN